MVPQMLWQSDASGLQLAESRHGWYNGSIGALKGAQERQKGGGSDSQGPLNLGSAGGGAQLT